MTAASEDAGTVYYTMFDKDGHSVAQGDLDYEKQLLRAHTPHADGVETVIVVRDDMWVQAPGEEKWTHASRRGIALDEFTPTGSFQAWRDAAISAVRTGTEDIEGVATDHYVLTVDRAKVMESRGQTLAAGLPAEMDYELWMEPNGLLRQVVFDDSGVYLRALYIWGLEVNDAVAPPRDQVVEAK